MRPVELEIMSLGGTLSTQHVEVPLKATLKEIADAIRELCHRCHWRKVRIGVGQNWSNWIY